MIDELPDKRAARKRAARWLLVAVYGTMIFFVSSLSDPVPIALPDIISLDKIAHLFEYAIFGILIFRAVHLHTSLKKSFLITVLIASLYGITDEIHQHFIEMREPDIIDWLADTMGGIIGSYIGMSLLKGETFE